MPQTSVKAAGRVLEGAEGPAGGRGYRGAQTERDQRFCENRNSAPEIIVKRYVW